MGVWCLQVLDWLSNHGEVFIRKNTGIGRNLQKARVYQKSHEHFENVAQVSVLFLLLTSRKNVKWERNIGKFQLKFTCAKIVFVFLSLLITINLVIYQCGVLPEDDSTWMCFFAAYFTKKYKWEGKFCKCKLKCICAKIVFVFLFLIITIS